MLLGEFQPADVPALVVQIFHLHLHLLVLPLELDDALPEVFARHHRPDLLLCGSLFKNIIFTLAQSPEELTILKGAVVSH